MYIKQFKFEFNNEQLNKQQNQHTLQQLHSKK